MVVRFALCCFLSTLPGYSSLSLLDKITNIFSISSIFHGRAHAIVQIINDIKIYRDFYTRKCRCNKNRAIESCRNCYILRCVSEKLSFRWGTKFGLYFNSLQLPTLFKLRLFLFNRRMWRWDNVWALCFTKSISTHSAVSPTYKDRRMWNKKTVLLELLQVMPGTAAQAKLCVQLLIFSCNASKMFASDFYVLVSFAALVLIEFEMSSVCWNNIGR